MQSGQAIAMVGMQRLAYWYRTTDLGQRVYSFDGIDYWPSKPQALEYAQQTTQAGLDFAGKVDCHLPALSRR